MRACSTFMFAAGDGDRGVPCRDAKEGMIRRRGKRNLDMMVVVVEYHGYVCKALVFGELA